MVRSTTGSGGRWAFFALIFVATCGHTQVQAVSKSQAVERTPESPDRETEAIFEPSPVDSPAAEVTAVDAVAPEPSAETVLPPAPVETRPPWTATTRLADPPVDELPKGAAGIVAHTPAGFDASAPIHLVLFLHGSNQCVAQIVLSGDVVCRPGAAPRKGSALAARHDDAGTNSILIAPQFLLWGGGTPGKMTERGYFRSFIEEVLRDTLAPGVGGPKTLDDLADITIVAHSAGHMPLSAILDSQELDDKIKNVVLLDALYDGRVGTYARWLERGIAAGDDRKLVAIYGDWGRNPATGRAIAARIEAQAEGSVAIDPPGALTDAIRSHRVTVAIWNVDHRRMLVLTLSKVLAALGLPPRPIFPPRTPHGDLPVPTEIALGARITGKLDVHDASLENGALFDDYAIDLDAQQQVDIDLRGGWSKTEARTKLDVFLEVLHDDRSLAQDDDGSGEFDASLAFTAPEQGRYIIRVSTSGSLRRRGGYTLLVK